MHYRQHPFRNLYEELLGSSDLVDTLAKWTKSEAGADVSGVRSRIKYPSESLGVEDLWVLYALLRCLERLHFAEREGTLHKDHVIEFATDFGLAPINEPSFHPFFHEIVNVHQSNDPNAPPEIVKSHWTGFALGPLMIARSGVTLASGRKHLSKELAEASTLYWANHRPWRPAEDQSHGWGSNSQWRTELRQDFLHAGFAHFNAFANGSEDPDLSPLEATELVRYRCFVTHVPKTADPYPYNKSVTEKLT